MIELALKGGGTDNVTVIIADVVDVDFGDDAPIVGGAAGDGSDERHQGNSPAARARALTAPPPPQHPAEQQPPAEDPKARRRKRFRWLIGGLVVLIVLAAAAVTTRFFVLSQYYVGEGADQEVVIFRGVPGSILGIKLQKQEQGSCLPDTVCDVLRVPELQEAARIAVKDGVKKDNLDEARNYIDVFLRGHKLITDCAGQPAGTTTPTTPTPSLSITPPLSSSAPPTDSTAVSPGQPSGRDCSTPTQGGGN
jgi:hypothetical protein